MKDFVNWYLLKTLISSEYGLTISSHATVLRQWQLEKKNYNIIMYGNTYAVFAPEPRDGC